MRIHALLSAILLTVCTLHAYALPLTPSAKSAPVSAGARSEYDQGLQALNDKKLDLAESLFLKAAEMERTAPGPLLGLAEVARLRKNDADVEKWVRKALDVAPRSAESQLGMGRLLYARRDYSGAEKFLMKAAEADPKSPTPLLDLGELHLSAKRPARAVEMFEQAVKLNPKHGGAHFGLGHAHMQTRNLVRAHASFKEAVRLSPDNPLALIGLSQAQAAQGKLDDATASLHAARKLAPGLHTVHLQLGMLYQQAKRWTEAYAAYLEAIKLNGELPIAYNNLAWMAAERRERLPEALQWAQKAVDLAPGNPEFVDTLAWVKRAQGNQKGAIALLESITVSQQASPFALYHLGIAKAEAGQTKEAIAAFKRVMSATPRFAEADDVALRIKQLETR
jgi:tetratricopeptide (TPR) repeat protein